MNTQQQAPVYDYATGYYDPAYMFEDHPEHFNKIAIGSEKIFLPNSFEGLIEQYPNEFDSQLNPKDPLNLASLILNDLLPVHRTGILGNMLQQNYDICKTLSFSTYNSQLIVSKISNQMIRGIHRAELLNVKYMYLTLCNLMLLYAEGSKSYDVIRYNF